jgi:hypothetical protein
LGPVVARRVAVHCAWNRTEEDTWRERSSAGSFAMARAASIRSNQLDVIQSASIEIEDVDRARALPRATGVLVCAREPLTCRRPAVDVSASVAVNLRIGRRGGVQRSQRPKVVRQAQANWRAVWRVAEMGRDEPGSPPMAAPNGNDN